MGRKAIPEKLKKKIYQESGMVCPICGENDVTTFEIHHITPYSVVNEHEEENLILLCSNCHSKVTANEITESEILRIKAALSTRGHDSLAKPCKKNNVIYLNNNKGIIANTVEINTPRNQTFHFSPPTGSIAANLNYLNYTKYLIKRYHEYKTADVGKKAMKYTIIYNAIKREFGAKWDLVPVNKFKQLSFFLQQRIDKTILGKNKKANNIKRYSTFDEYLDKYCK